MMWGKLIKSGNNTQLFSVNIISYYISKTESQADSAYTARPSLEFLISRGGNTADFRYTHSLSGLLATRVCYLRILQGCWLSDWSVYCVYGTLLCGLPSSCAALWGSSVTPGQTLLASPWSSWRQQHHLCGGSWIFTKLAEGSLAIAVPMATAVAAASPNALVVYKTNRSFHIWGQMLYKFVGCICRCGPERKSGITAGIEIWSDLFQVSNQSLYFWAPEALSQSFWFWSGSA